MFVKLNERVYLNMLKITRTKIDHVEDGIRVRFMKEKIKLQNQKDLKQLKMQTNGLKNLLNLLISSFCR